MAWRFIRNALFALISSGDRPYSRIDLPVTQPVEEYLAFVISTDLSLDPVAEQLGKVGKLVSE